jgi:microcystin-dependent protein
MARLRLKLACLLGAFVRAFEQVVTRQSTPAIFVVHPGKDGRAWLFGICRKICGCICDSNEEGANHVGDYYLGEIRLFSQSYAPQGWLPCDGRTLQISQYQALYALLGNQFGGDGGTNFLLPDLRGRAVVGYGNLANTSSVYRVGQYGGTESVTLTNANLPPHTHEMVADSADATTASPGQNYLAILPGGLVLYDIPGLRPSPTPPVALNPASVSSVGGGSAHNNLQPYLTMTYCISTTGLWPQRP